MNFTIFTIQGTKERGTSLLGQVEDMSQIGDPEEDIPGNLTQVAKNMLILDNEKAFYVANYLKRYFFRESGFVSETQELY